MKKKTVISALLLSASLLGPLSNAIPVVHAGASEEKEDKVLVTSQEIEKLTEKQKQAATELNNVYSKVSNLEDEKERLETETDKLEATSKELEGDITELSKNIVSRKDSLEKQARSAQTNGSALTYVDAIVNSKSISDAISKVVAMNEVVSASNKMLEQQKADKENVQAKQEKNNKAINTVIANKEKLEADAQSLNTKKAELEVAKLNLEVEKADAEERKANLEAQKAEAEKLAKDAAEKEKAYKETKAQENAIVANSANTTLLSEVASVSTASATEEVTTSSSTEVTEEARAEATEETPVEAVATPKVETRAAIPEVKPASSRPKYNTDASSYPMGECTWGAKTLAPWAGDYWGNGAQWATSAAAAGFRTGSTPQVGAIACWNDGGYGHVAVVTAVESATRIQVSESNYGKKRYIGNHRGWFNPTTTSEGFVTYIYAD